MTSNVPPIIIGTDDSTKEAMRVDPSGNVGIGTTTPTNPLHVNGNAGIRQNRLYMSGGDGWGSLTYNAHRNDTNSEWVFPDPSRPAVTIGFRDRQFGQPGFEVWSTTEIDKTDWQLRFSIDSISGLVTILGDLDVRGTLTKGAGTFKIDHPLDPARKYLSHAFVESAEMKDLYDGVVLLDACGEACVELPYWFEALNRDFRYQLTCLGGYAPVYVAEKIRDHRFKIAGGKAGMEVCWLVTGIRHDSYAQAHPLIVEQEKGEPELGSYRHPELYGKQDEEEIA